MASSALAEKTTLFKLFCFWKPNARHQLLLHHYQVLHVRLEVSGSHDMNGELDESAYRFDTVCLPALACTFAQPARLLSVRCSVRTCDSEIAHIRPDYDRMRPCASLSHASVWRRGNPDFSRASAASKDWRNAFWLEFGL